MSDFGLDWLISWLIGWIEGCAIGISATSGYTAKPAMSNLGWRVTCLLLVGSHVMHVMGSWGFECGGLRGATSQWKLFLKKLCVWWWLSFFLIKWTALWNVFFLHFLLLIGAWWSSFLFDCPMILPAAIFNLYEHHLIMLKACAYLPTSRSSGYGM